ncbi:histidine kinase [Flavobacterium sp.]|uniref:sensor histidine kinase n=1 Tax=Flavobacterium sp. TaxID=239 RepID=UPI002632C1A9|nr:histidine kinase [Flavobacterium sp.]
MKIFAFLFILLFTNLGFCQNPFYVSIDKTSGLPSNSVYDILQDSKGFMWFATGKGICRYDGSTFKTFSSDEQTSKSGSCLVEDGFGRIWYSNFDGYLYYVEKNVLKSLKQPTSLGYFRFGIIKDELFLLQPNMVLIYDLRTLKVKSKIKISDKQISFSYASPEKFYVLGASLYEFNDSKTYTKHPLPNKFYDEINGSIMNYWDHKLIINSKSNNIYYSFKDGEFTRNALNTTTNFNQNTSIVNNTIWICTTNGIIKNDLDSKETITYFADQNISYLFRDNHKNYWISTLNKGILFIEDFENNYIDIQPRPLTLSLGKNEIYIGAEKDLVYKLNLKKLVTEKVFETENNHATGQIFADTITNNLFFTSFKFNILKNNKIISDYAVAIKDVKKVDHKYFSFAASGISGLFFVDENLKSDWDIIFNKNKSKEFSGFGQSMLIKRVNGKSTEYNAANKTIYYATNNGLIAVTNDGKNEEIKYKNKTLHLIKIQKYKDQIYGLSTSEKMYVINSSNEVSPLKLPYFLSNENFNKFFICNQYCYLFTSNSVYEFNFISSEVLKVLSLSSDIEATDIILKNNKLFFATSKGIVIKNRKEIGNYPKPKLFINEFQVNGKHRELNKFLLLQPDENDISINFSTLSFIPNESYSVFYKINDSDWKILDAATKNLKLSALSSGNYTILLALNYNNQKIDFQQIKFEIKKPFWLSYFFIFISSLLLLLLFFTFYKYQIRKIEKQNEILLQKNELEKNLNLSTLKAIKSQMNPHFFYNALNTIQSYILANDKKQAVNYLSKFSSLTRNILEMTEKEFISINEEITTMSLYLDIEKARFDKDFEYEINTENISDLEHKIPSMLLQPYIENAVKHGLLHKNGLKKLLITFSKNGDKIRIEIDDNGIGRQKSAELNAIKNKNHNSFATNAMQNRIDLLNKNNKNKITIDFIDKMNQSKQSQGTTVVIEIPIN